MPPVNENQTENEQKKGFIEKTGTAVKDWWQDLHIGEGHFTASMRQGFKEVTHLLLPAFPAGQQIIEEPGLFGNPTQGEVARGRQDKEPAKQQVASLNEEPVQTRMMSPGELNEGKSSEPVQSTGQSQHQGGDIHGPANGVHGRNNTAQGPQAESPASFRDISPGELNEAKELFQQGWKERQEHRQENGNQNGNGDNGQNEQAQFRSLPNEQRDRGRGR
jgi:hypothetical protein